MTNVERPCELYRITHRESGKDYVGVSVCVKNRWKSHRSHARRGVVTPFYAALRKYGPEAFDWVVIARARNYVAACALERMARHLGLGSYNLTMGGEGAFDPSPETRARMRAAQRTRVLSPEAKTRMLEGARAANTGRKASEETRAKLRAAQANRVLSPEAEARMLRGARKGFTGHTHTEAARAKIRDTHAGRKRSPETIARMQAAARLRWADPEYRAKVTAAIRAAKTGS